MTEVIWPEGFEGGGFHDGRCRCEGHCLLCFANLAEVREVREQLIAGGHLPESTRLGPRERYCSPWCRNRAKRERALDRHLTRVKLIR